VDSDHDNDDYVEPGFQLPLYLLKLKAGKEDMIGQLSGFLPEEHSGHDLLCFEGLAFIRDTGEAQVLHSRGDDARWCETAPANTIRGFRPVSTSLRENYEAWAERFKERCKRRKAMRLIANPRPRTMLTLQPGSETRPSLLFFRWKPAGRPRRGVRPLIDFAALLTDPTGTSIREEFSATVLDPSREKAAPKSELDWVALEGPMLKLATMGRNAIFTTHDGPAQFGFIQAGLKKVMRNWLGPLEGFDTKDEKGFWNVDFYPMLATFGIDPENDSALADARACRELYLRRMAVLKPNGIVDGASPSAS
jgi:hypothetical protein